jgi:multiple sugar transport system substrate-binding protein
MKRRMIAALALAVVSLLCSGCPQPSEPPSTDGRVHVTYWEKWTGFEGDAMRDTVEAFNRSQSRVYVDLLTVSQIDQKTLMATAGGIPPDIAGVWSPTVIPYAQKRAALPLDDFLREKGITKDRFVPAFWEMCQYRGHTYAIPTTPASVALHWNKRLFREAGLDPNKPPKTIEELDAMADKLTRVEDGKIVQMGFLPPEPGWWNWSWGCFFGGRLWDGKSRLTCDSPENVRAYEWVQKYAKKYGVEALQTFRSGFGNFSSPQNAFMAEKVAMELQGVWLYNFIDKYMPSLEWGAAPFPYPADRPDLANTTVAEEDVVIIPRGARHPREAFEFLAFLATTRGSEILNMGQRKFTPLIDVTPEFLRKHPNPAIEVFINLAHSSNAVSVPHLSIWNEYQDELNAAFDEIWLCRETPQQALSHTRERVQKRVDWVIRAESRDEG